MKQRRWDLIKQWWCDHFGHRAKRDEWGCWTCTRCRVLIGGPANKIEDLRDEVWHLRSDVATWHNIVEKKDARIEAQQAEIERLYEAVQTTHRTGGQ